MTTLDTPAEMITTDIHPALGHWELPQFVSEAELPPRDPAPGQERIAQFREALREAMSHEMRQDKKVFLIGEEVAEYNGAYKISQGMLDEFGPERIIDSPISENGFAGMCIGAAMYGLRPIVEFMSWSFSFVAADAILNNAPKMLYMSGGQWGCPIVFRGNDGAGGQLASTHSWCVEGLFSNVPGLKMAIPSNPYDAKGLLATAIRDPDPVFFLESERMLGDKAHVPEEQYYIPFGRARLAREGSDVTLVSFGRPVHFCMEAAEALAEEGIECDVLDMRTIRPLDIDAIIESVKKTSRVIVVDQSWPFGGVSSEVITQICERCFDWLDSPPARVNTKDVPTPYAKNLEADYLPNATKIAAAVRNIVNA
jgi:pyruvate dehydrogenase E1 component beta subunit